MKTKKLSKKMGLNKKTIANLNKNEMESANGGASEYPCNTTWDVCDPTHCSTICDWTERRTCITTQ